MMQGTQAEINAKREQRAIHSDDTCDAYGNQIRRGDHPKPCPIATRWKFWKEIGLLPKLLKGKVNGWRSWREASSPLDIPTFCNLPG